MSIKLLQLPSNAEYNKANALIQNKHLTPAASNFWVQMINDCIIKSFHIKISPCCTWH